MFVDVTLVPEAIPDAQEILRQWEDEHAGYYGTPAGLAGQDYGGFGYKRLPAGGRWLTSGRNYHAIEIIPNDGVRVTYCGRRHGMRAEFRALLRRYWRLGGDRHWVTGRLHAYVTQEPTWAPWETRDDRLAAEG